MKNWKIKRINYVAPSYLNTNDISQSYIEPGDHIYNCYRRKLLFFWVLKRQMNDKEYFHLKKSVESYGCNIRDLCIHSNF